MKRIISLFIIFAFLLAVVPAVSISAAPSSVDLSGVADGGEYIDGNGDIYIVLKSASTILDTVKADMTANYILGSNIDFDGKLFYSYIFNNGSGDPFTGIFDGNGYSILNFRTNANFNAKVGLLFGSLSGTAKIKNLTVGSEAQRIPFSVTSDVANAIGGIVGYTVAGTKATFSNVNVYADISLDAQMKASVFVGGFVGQSDPLTMTDCNFYGSIVFTENARLSDYNTMAGGFVGRYNQSAGQMKIINCKSYASIDISNRTIGTTNGIRTVAGGILGSTDYPFTIRNCENHGTITGDKTTGGIVGEIVGVKESDYSYEIIGCKNFGDVTGEIYAGGILGLCATNGDSSNSTYSVSILNCLNVANITANTLDSNYITGGNSGAGGIAGRINRGYIVVQDCGSVGAIAGNGRTGTAASTANGIVGMLLVNSDAERLAVISDCYAVGALTPYNASYSVYGTCAAFSNSVSNGYVPYISNCYYSLTATKGTLKAISMTTYANDYGDYEYTECSAVSADDVSDGSLLALLGDGFTQTIGTDAYPLPIQPEYVDDTESDNRFSSGVGGYYGADGEFISDIAYTTRERLRVMAGDVITVGAFSDDQDAYACLFDSELEPIKQLSLSDLTLVEALGGGYGIYSYTVTEGAAYMSVSVLSRRAYITLLTVNNTFDAEEYYEFFGISAMTGSSDSPLWQKSALFIGDSICYGFDDVVVGSKLRSYGGRIAYDYDMTYVNAGVSGATLSTVSGRKLIRDQIEPYKNQKFDYVVIEGGINDALNKVSVGEITQGLYSGLDTSTYAGALEELFRLITKTYPQAKVGFLITYECPRNASHETYITYQDITKQICEKWDIEYFDMFSSDEINDTVLESSNRSSKYMPDGIHPNELGYDRLSPYIAEFMETLSIPAPSDGSASNGDGGSNDVTQQPTDDGEEPTDNTEQDTATPSQDGTTDSAEEEGGCGSVVGASAVFMISVIFAVTALSVKRKKHYKEEIS